MALTKWVHGTARVRILPLMMINLPGCFSFQYIVPNTVIILLHNRACVCVMNCCCEWVRSSNISHPLNHEPHLAISFGQSPISLAATTPRVNVRKREKGFVLNATTCNIRPLGQCGWMLIFGLFAFYYPLCMMS